MPAAKHCIAVAARTLGLIHADLTVALSLTHKAITFDRRMSGIDYDALTLASTGTLPSGCPEPSGQTVPATSNNPAGPPHAGPARPPASNPCPATGFNVAGTATMQIITVIHQPTDRPRLRWDATQHRHPCHTPF